VAKFPYAGLPAQQLWKRAVTDVPRDAVDPQGGVARFTIDRTTRIASAGSCFAQRIAERLLANGYTYFVTEPGSGYSARYGDIYTPLQLKQLVERAMGTFEPAEPLWTKNGRWYDPFRPRVEENGFASPEELEAARIVHFAAVRRMLTESDVFVFTLGLTETWCSRADGAAFPLCPGAGIGTFDDAKYEFRNLTVDENVRYLEEFLALAWSFNPALQIILTVSPVPLVATMEPAHVIQSSTYSKSVLRVAAETVRRAHPRVEYFASYEICATGYDGEDHYGDDRRDVNDAAVDRVMRSFFRAFAPSVRADLPVIALSLGAVARAAAAPAPRDPCDEQYLARLIDADARR
jgi:hypothetical protein